MPSYRAALMDPSDPSTTQLLHLFETQPREGFAALYERESERLYLWAALHVRPVLRQAMPLDDFVQEVWARAFIARASFDPSRGHIRGWILGIAKNVLRELLRHPRRSRGCSLEDLEKLKGNSEPSDHATSVISRAGRSEERQRLLDFVDGLPPEDRSLTVWRGLEMVSHEEVATRLGITAVAAESRWRRLLPRLRAGVRWWSDAPEESP
ncbi:MAG: RNA polymerase sigma factor [Planctomycetota bacterium]